MVNTLRLGSDEGDGLLQPPVEPRLRLCWMLEAEGCLQKSLWTNPGTDGRSVRPPQLAPRCCLQSSPPLLGCPFWRALSRKLPLPATPLDFPCRLRPQITRQRARRCPCRHRASVVVKGAHMPCAAPRVIAPVLCWACIPFNAPVLVVPRADWVVVRIHLLVLDLPAVALHVPARPSLAAGGAAGACPIPGTAGPRRRSAPVWKRPASTLPAGCWRTSTPTGRITCSGSLCTLYTSDVDEKRWHLCTVDVRPQMAVVC